MNMFLSIVTILMSILKQLNNEYLAFDPETCLPL